MRLPPLALLMLMMSTIGAGVQAQPVQPAIDQLRQQSAAGTLDAARDVEPLLRRVRAGGPERDIGPLLRALAELVENGRTPLALRDRLRGELPALIIAFARGPASAMERDSVLVTLRDVEAGDADTRAGIALAEAEADRGYSYFASTAALLKAYAQGRQPVATPAVVARAEPARPDAPRPTPGQRPTPSTPTAQADLTLDAQFDTMMRAAQQAMNDRRHAQVLGLTLGFEQKLAAADPTYARQTMWAYLLDFKRYAQFETRDKAGSRATCRRAVERLNADAPETPDGHVVRGTLRACHNMLAWDAQAGARHVDAIEVAIRHIDACFASVAANEPPSVVDDFYETRATVFLKAMRFGGERWRKPLFETLSEAQARGVDLGVSPELAAVMTSRDYLDYRKTGGVPVKPKKAAG